jgi:thiamine monophosphate synthase
MYPTTSKIKSSSPKSLQELKKVCSAVSIPVIAIGGITLNNSVDLFQSKIDGVAVVSAFSEADAPRYALQELVRLFSAQL